ncbi:MAG: metallophosphoesterase [Lachnospiraceae bacterium]|nr:metallophosphoesterase [Lachnospiraceae bacterium]
MPAAQKGPKDFFIADLHFGDSNIIRYENRPFSSAEEMDACLIENWNRCVSAQDTVYVLGDFSAFGSSEKDREILRRLQGIKILIMGNHDSHYTAEEWRSLGFAECSRWPILYQNFFLLSHEPLYINANMPYANIYGHVHNNASYKDASQQSVCISAERIGYRPIEFAEIRARMREAAENTKEQGR